MKVENLNVVLNAYDNNNDALVPELWAMEAVAILEENMVIGNLVHRDFEDKIAEYGDVVHTSKPGTFTAKRKTDADDVTVQDASSTGIQVPLNQHVHVSFIIKDGERSKAFVDLVSKYLRPALLANAQHVDQVLLGQHVHFKENFGGHLGEMSSNNAKDFVLDTRLAMNINKAPMAGRNMIVTPNAETELLKLELFTSAEKVGDEGTALREASLGRKLGFDFFMCQNMTQVATGNTAVTGAINLSAGYAKGATALTVDGFSAAITAGSFVTIEGDDTPHRVASTTGGSTPTVITLASPGLRRAVLNDAVVTVYTPGAVNLSDGYAAGYAKEITVNGFTVAPQTGQTVAFGTATNTYTIIGTPTTTSIMLDRPLDVGISNGAAVCIGPVGSYNFAFLREALALVSRPLAQPASGTGALSTVINYKGLSVRVVITYNGIKQGHLVTIDFLMGVAVLDTDLGAVLYG